MATEIVMPRLGWTMEAGSIVEWLKKDGDVVKQGDIVFTVESDKAINEIESFESGVLRIPPDSPRPGAMVPVGQLLAYLVQPGESAPFETSAVSGSSASAPVSAPAIEPVATLSDAKPAKQVGSSNGRQSPAISPRARRVAGELKVDWKNIAGSGRMGRIVERDIRIAAAQQPAVTTASMSVSPLARRVAGELNVDLEALATAMPGKRIEKADVERAAFASEAKPIPSKPVAAAHSAAVATTARSGESRRPISNVRHTIGKRMADSVHTAAPVTLTTEADATELVTLRKQLKKDGEATGRVVPTYNDLLTKLVAELLVEFPAINSRFEGDEIVLSEAVHIGTAVDTDRGLLVPVIRDVQSKSLHQIARESATLVERARAGAVTKDEMSGGTFSISNLGMYEIDAFTPIINLPECAILGVGRIIPKQVVVDVDAGTVAIRHMLFLSLTFDHRLVDGAPAARFLQRLKQSLEHPYSWLL